MFVTLQIATTNHVVQIVSIISPRTWCDEHSATNLRRQKVDFFSSVMTYVKEIACKNYAG